MLRKNCATSFQLVTPGIRPVFASKDDQARIVTPADAVRFGVNYLVVGRPVTQANEPIVALQQIMQELDEV